MNIPTPRSKLLRLWLLAFCTLAASQTAQALQPSDTPVLLMFEEAHCPYCDKWKREVGIIYHKTPQGKQYPLQMMNIDDIAANGYGALRDIRYTPTFIVWDGNGEAGRITGYNAEDFFWGLLDQILEQLPVNRTQQ